MGDAVSHARSLRKESAIDRSFHSVDVFAAERFAGNPLAVIHDADELSTATMQRITRWMNLSETAFLLRPTAPAADYRVRIFTLARELPFAGHPTLGACHAWLAAGGRPRADQIVQECGAGPVRLRRTADRLAFAAPPIDTFARFGPLDDHARRELTDAMRLDPGDVLDAHWVDNGPGWAALLMEGVEQVLAVEPVAARPGGLDVGIIGPHPAGSPYAFEVRAFFTDDRGRVVEDPVTGSLNASVAQWLLHSGRVTASYVARQGTRLGRTGVVHVDVDDDGQVWVGGPVRTIVAGVMPAR